MFCDEAVLQRWAQVILVWHTLFLWNNHLQYFLEHASDHAPVPYNVSSERTYMQCHSFVVHKRKSVFEVNFPVNILLIWKERNYGKLTAKILWHFFWDFCNIQASVKKNCPCYKLFPIHEKSAAHVWTCLKWILWLRHLMIHCDKNCRRWVTQCRLHLMTKFHFQVCIQYITFDIIWLVGSVHHLC